MIRVSGSAAAMDILWSALRPPVSNRMQALADTVIPQIIF